MSAPLRVLHIVGGMGAGGIENFLMNLYRAMDRDRIQFDFLLHTEEGIVFREEIQALGGRIFLQRPFLVYNLPAYAVEFRRFLRAHPEYSVIHIHKRTVSALCSVLARREGRFSIVHSHNTANGRGIAALGKDLLQFPARYTADVCMGCSQTANEWMFGRRRARNDSCRIVRNGIDLARFRFHPEVRRRLRRELGYGDDVFLMGTVGRLVAQKNQALLLDAMPETAARRPEARLLIVGEGPLRRDLERQTARLDMDGFVRLTGERNDVDALLSALDLFVLTSRHEGMPVSLIEAQANGVPVLVSAAAPEEAYATDLIRRVPGGGTASDWAAALASAAGRPGTDPEPALRAAGYDIRQTAAELTAYYLQIAGNRRGDAV